MILLPDLKNKKTVGCLVLASTGIATAEALVASGAQRFYTWDENGAAREKTNEYGVSRRTPEKLAVGGAWRFLVLSPAYSADPFPKPHAIVRKARSAKEKIPVMVILSFSHAH